jgi:hypothetical protein
MKKYLSICVVIFLAVFMISCGRKESETKTEEGGKKLTPVNAPSKYGEVMGRALKKSKAMDDLLYLRNKINTFQIQEGRYPYTLQELVEKGLTEQLPEPPEGMKFVYQPDSGKVSVQ